ncbi:MAG: glycosyltransferase family 4 protein, partial [Lachnospiraceae bacterium]|nr:glycosyltransferase family 4 protein [Lachnospiraceae bacterium]
MIGHKVVPSRRGGIELVLTTLTPLLVKRGCEVTCYNRSGDKIENEYIGMVKDHTYKGVELKKVFTINKKGIAALISSFVASVCVAVGKYDVVHYHAEGPCAMMWIPKLFGKKCIATVHGLDWKREKWGTGFGSRYIKFGEKILAKYADKVIVLSKKAQKYFKDCYGIETVLIPNGVVRPQKQKPQLIKEMYNLEG